jgi:hypothetical protein
VSPARLSALLLCTLVLAGLLATRAAAAPGMLVGVDDDTLKWVKHPAPVVAIDRDLGFDAVRVTIPWRPGVNRPTRLSGTFLHRVALTIGLGQPVVLAVYGRADQAPLTAASRAQYCSFLSHVAARLPVRGIVIWNEANSARFWPAARGAAAYEALLARCWDALHALRRPVPVIASTAAHHDAGGFLRALGAAYRASGRTRPLVDVFGHNPSPDAAAEPPWAQHSDQRTIGQGDLQRLLDALRTGFDRTAQPLPAPGRPSVWYMEDGFQTAVPAAKRHGYRGVENDLTALPSTSASSGAARALRDQAMQLRDALLLAYCQPEVGAFFNFELRDESLLAGWQSGLLWSDGTPKPSYATVKELIRLIHAGHVDCKSVTGV